MIIDNVAINTEMIVSVQFNELQEYVSKDLYRPFYEVSIFFNNSQMPMVVRFEHGKDKDAKDFFNRVSAKIKDEKALEKDYIQGFKDGVEYAKQVIKI